MLSGALPSLPQGRRWLIVVAAPAEGRAVLRGLAGRPGDRIEPLPAAPPVSWISIPMARFDLVVSGVGKANAAGATSRAFDHAVHAGVLNLGVAGSLPGSTARVTEVLFSSLSVYADEGSAAPEGFTDVAAMGFPPGQDAGVRSIGVQPGKMLRDALRPLADHIGPIATVSTCSGTDSLALEIAHRTGAIAEAMEGAAIGFTCLRLARDAENVPFAELRVISNTTGDRARQRWDLKGALERLSRLVASL